MARYSYPGHPAFLEAAATELGRPDAVRAARRVPAVGAVSNLCAQAADGAPADAPAILDQAEAWLDPLRVALRAAELMVAAVRAEHARPDAPAHPERAAEARPTIRRHKGA